MLVPIQLCQNNMCTGITPAPPAPAPIPQPVLPIRSGGGGAGGGGAGFYVSMPGYLDPYEPPKEALVIEGELVEAELQQAEVRAAIARVLATHAPADVVAPDELVDRLIRQAEVRTAVEDAVQHDREERGWEDEARVLAARLWADLQARQALRERDEAHERQLRELQVALRDADDRWQGLHVKVQQLEQAPPPAPASQLVVPPAPQQAPDASLRRLWVGVALTAAIVATAVFALSLLKPSPPAPTTQPKRKRRRRR